MPGSKKQTDEVWYVHAPLKNEKRPIVHAPPPSNIPYINGVFDTDEDMAKKQEIWFKETDSPFVRLSKLGGREDLLIHKHKEGSKEPVAYPRPAWWTDMLSEMPNPDQQTNNQAYVFQVPAWFAHTSSIPNTSDEKVSHQYPYETLNNNSNSSDQKQDGIQEPTRYGQLRNFLNPVSVKTNKASLDNQKPSNRNHAKKPNDPTTMPKLIANSYQNERPLDYLDWKEKQEKNPNAFKTTRKNLV